MQAKTRSGTTDTLALQAFHPVAHAPGEFTQDLGPVAYEGILRAWTGRSGGRW